MKMLTLLSRLNFGLVLFAVAVSAVCFSLFNRIDGESSEADRRLRETMIAVADLEAALGYGGFVHNFKNYVLRGTDRYRIEADRRYRDAMQALVRLEHAIGLESYRQAATVRAMIEAYREQLDVAQAAWARGLRPEGIDPLVTIDDSQPLRALRALAADAIAAMEARHGDLVRDRYAILVMATSAEVASLMLAVMLMLHLNRVLYRCGERY